MMLRLIAGAVLVVALLVACEEGASEQERRDVAQQQNQYMIGQPIPSFPWSLERHLMIELYLIRNQRVATHAVWRSDYGLVEGDCASIGFGLPYDTSLTNPVMRATNYHDSAVIEQPEPNGIFASKNTAATWVLCVGEGGSVNPVYIESKVTVYPWPVAVDYENNRVVRAGDPSVLIDTGSP